MWGTAATLGIGAVIGAVACVVLRKIGKAVRRRREGVQRVARSEAALLKRFGRVEREAKRLGACRNAHILDQQRVLHVMSELSRLALRKEPSDNAFEKLYNRFVEEANALSGHRILEIGSRNVTGNEVRPHFRGYKEYVGFDVHPGENVDVVGDAHRLSEHFPRAHFDVVISYAVFEHMAMPWKVVQEINKVMKPGGMLYILTVANWPGHEQPWDFWRFSKEAWKVLLNAKTGFSVTGLEEGVPSAMFPPVPADEHYTTAPDLSVFDLKVYLYPANLLVNVTAKKIGSCSEGLSWDVQLEDILDTRYPIPDTRAHVLGGRP